VWSLLHLVSCCSDRVWSVKRVCTSLPVKTDMLAGDEAWICLVAIASPGRGVEGKSKAPQLLSKAQL